MRIVLIYLPLIGHTSGFLIAGKVAGRYFEIFFGPLKGTWWGDLLLGVIKVHTLYGEYEKLRLIVPLQPSLNH
tara:strand:+ start:557 stop:775 length:219 start_codon:yes stop_codon:yes gene_type:complete